MGAIRTLTGLWDASGWSVGGTLPSVYGTRSIRTLTGHTEGVSSVSFSPDGNTIASGSLDDYYPSVGRAVRGTHTYLDRSYS